MHASAKCLVFNEFAMRHMITNAKQKKKATTSINEVAYFRECPNEKKKKRFNEM